jgi:hypothetical protein
MHATPQAFLSGVKKTSRRRISRPATLRNWTNSFPRKLWTSDSLLLLESVLFLRRKRTASNDNNARVVLNALASGPSAFWNLVACKFASAAETVASTKRPRGEAATTISSPELSPSYRGLGKTRIRKKNTSRQEVGVDCDGGGKSASTINAKRIEKIRPWVGFNKPWSFCSMSFFSYTASLVSTRARH